VEENRGAWLVAGSAFSATLITLGAVFLLADSNGDRASSTPRPALGQSASPAPEKTRSSPEPAEPQLPPSPSSSPREAVDRLLVAWVQNDRVAALQVATRAAVKQTFEEPLEFRSDFYLTACDKHQGDWTCSLSYRLDDRVGYTLGIGRSDHRFWVEFAGLIVL
jgi:hypothetical protein